MSRSTAIEVFLQPGEYFVGDASWRIRTLLGSCVSITLWHARLRVGAMSHFLLASRGRAADDELDARYGDEAFTLMARDLFRMGVNPVDCEAKVFGGGDMFPNTPQRAAAGIGQVNGDAARALLGRQGIAIVGEHLYGVGHRQIIFDVSTGHVWARQHALQRPNAPPKS